MTRILCPEEEVHGHEWSSMERTDFELIESYVKERDEAAFGELVRRHAGFVHASARRQTDDVHHAEEITQAVFLLLARKASTFRSDVILSGWLFRATRFASNDLRRSEIRRQHRETNAYHHMQQELSNDADHTEDGESWSEVSGVLDECLAKLGDHDRHALLMRFFEDKPLAEVGRALGTTAEAARKRVSRALEKLHGLLELRGVRSSVTGLEALLMAHALTPSSGELAASTLAAVSRLASDGSAQTTASVLAGSVLKRLAWTQLRPWLAAAAMLAMAAVSTGWVMSSHAASTAPSESGNYRAAGYPDPAVVNQQVRRIQDAIQRGDRSSLAEMIQFPLRINADTGTFIISDVSTWEKRFDELFPAVTRSAFLKSPAQNLLATPDGIMIGSGEAWLARAQSPRGDVAPRISTINLSTRH